MPLYYIKFNILDNARSDYLAIFGAMTEQDDIKDMGEDVKLLGRWLTIGQTAAFCICEVKNNQALSSWLLNWVNMCTIVTIPIVDDNDARRIILNEEPDYLVDYDKVKNEANEGENLYVIEYEFHKESRAQCFNLFANLPEDAGCNLCFDVDNNSCFGRWHIMGNGSGITICSSKSEFELYKGVYNWASISDYVITPVISDSAFKCIVNKSDFGKKYAILSEKIKGKPYKSWFK